MARKGYRSRCCNAEVKEDGMPDFIGGKEICTISFTCLKCGKGCNVRTKGKPKSPSKFPAWLPVGWSKEKREMARLILARSVASDFEYIRRELRLTSSVFCEKGVSPQDLVEVMNELIRRGLLKILVCLTNYGDPFFIFYNPRKYRPA